MFFKKVIGIIINILRYNGGGVRRSSQWQCSLLSCHRSLPGEVMCSWSTWSLFTYWCWCSRDASPTGSMWPTVLFTAWAPFFPCRSPSSVSRWALDWVGLLASFPFAKQLQLDGFILDLMRRIRFIHSSNLGQLVLTENNKIISHSNLLPGIC